MADVEGGITKHLSNIIKIGKSETDDKTKAPLLKSAGDTLREFKVFEKRRIDLNKRIKETKTLEKDIETYKREHTAFINDSVKLSQKVNSIKPDTKGRDYFMLANFLGMVGQSMIDDYP